MNNRDWTVLIIGGASGTGKSTMAYKIADYYRISVLEFDDIHRTVKTLVKKLNYEKNQYLAIHDLNGHNWKSLGVERNVNWLIKVSKEMSEFLYELVERHVEENVPVIIEGDFIVPEIIKPILSSKVKSIFVLEGDNNQIVNNFQSREGGEKQNFRAEISVSYNNFLEKSCKEFNILTLESRPWDNIIERFNNLLINE